MVWNDGPSQVDWLELKLLHTVVLACCLPPGLSVFLLKVVEKLHSKQISVESEKTLYCVTGAHE